jgi:hypothetical protein
VRLVKVEVAAEVEVEAVPPHRLAPKISMSI